MHDVFRGSRASLLGLMNSKRVSTSSAGTGFQEAAGETTSTREQETPLHTSGGFVVAAASSLG